MLPQILTKRTFTKCIPMRRQLNEIIHRKQYDVTSDFSLLLKRREIYITIFLLVKIYSTILIYVSNMDWYAEIQQVSCNHETKGRKEKKKSHRGVNLDIFTYCIQKFTCLSVMWEKQISIYLGHWWFNLLLLLPV